MRQGGEVHPVLSHRIPSHLETESEGKIGLCGCCTTEPCSHHPPALIPSLHNQLPTPH